MNRGMVVWVDLSDATPPEMGKRRPAVVVSNSVQNQVLDTLVAVPLSSQPPEIHPLRVRLRVAALPRPSYAVVPGLRLARPRAMHRAAKRQARRGRPRFS